MDLEREHVMDAVEATGQDKDPNIVTRALKKTSISLMIYQAVLYLMLMQEQ